ncbi:ABC transporter substrate-binding protein [Frankia sp. CiP1_Cm_nod1]|uniref:ABC transporter substrate-binding protein n=1 Tax=Frankia sp. CiP1_Cm_nod1 TaxID=2897160 RepID=UPI002024F00E
MPRCRAIIRAGTVTVVLGLLLAACTGGGGGRQAPSDPSGPPAAISSRVIAASPRDGGTLRVLATADCDSWDPQRTASVRCWNQQRWISRQLVTYAPSPGALRLAGDLATEVPAPKDLRTWTYTLREGLAFEDGTPITSRDVKYGIERAFAPELAGGSGGSGGAGSGEVVRLLQDEKNPYRGPYTDPTPDRLGLAAVTTPDDRTITFRLNRPFADWNLLMASPVSTPVPRAHDTGAGYGSRPVASGPYKIENYRPGESLTLVRNPEWDRQTDPNRPAHPDRVVERMGLAAADIDSRILTDQADIAADQSGVGAEATARISANPGLRAARTTSEATGGLRYLAVVTTVAPLDKLACRNAVAWAVDKSAQQTARGGPLVGGDIAATMLTPPVRSFSWFDLFPSPGGSGNPARARTELGACGRPDGFETTLVTRSDPLSLAQAEAVRASLARAGITVTVVKFDDAGYAAAVDSPEHVHTMKYGLVLAAGAATRPTPYAFLAPLAASGSIRPRYSTNIAELALPAVDQGLEQGIGAADSEDTASLWTQTDRAVVGSAAYVPLLYDRALNIYSSRLTNIHYSPGFMMTDFASLGVVP